MKRFLRSKLVLTLAALIMIAAAVVIPLSSNTIRTHAANGNTGVSVLVPATAQWVNTGIRLNIADQLNITATGSWTPAPSFGTWGPDGSPQLWPDNFLNLQDIGSCAFCASTPTPHFAALIGYIGDAPPAPGSYTSTSILPEAQKVFFVGSNFGVSIARTGVLWLNFNDDAYSNFTIDNAGQVTATVSVTPGVTPTALFRFPWDASQKLAFTGGPHAWIEPTRSGLDFSDGSTATHILAMADGVVTFVGQETCIEGSCNVVKVHHDNGWDVWYVHLSSFAPGIAPGVRVPVGTWLGNEGSSGAPAVHIHIELRLNGAPAPWAGMTIERWLIHQDCAGYNQATNQRQNQAPCLTKEYNGYINLGGLQVVPISSGPTAIFLTSTNHEVTATA